MAYTVALPNGQTVEVPDDVSPDQAYAEIQRYWEEMNRPPAEGGFVPAVKSGFSELKSGIAALLGKTGAIDEKTATDYIAEQERYQQQTFKPTTESWTEAPFQHIKELAGQSLPWMAAPVGAAGAAFALPASVAGASVLGGAATVGSAVATGAALLAGATQYTGSNLKRQLDEGESLQSASLGSAAAAAVPQALLDRFAFGMIPGLNKIFGVAGKQITEETAAAFAKQGLAKTIADYTASTGKAMTAEGLTEASQQFLERMQAGLQLDSPEARDEYWQSLIGGAVLGGTIAPVGRFLERGSEQAQAGQLLAERDRRLAAEAAQTQQEEQASKDSPEYAERVSADYLSLEDQIKQLRGQLIKEDEASGTATADKLHNEGINKQIDALQPKLKELASEYNRVKNLPKPEAAAPAEPVAPEFIPEDVAARLQNPLGKFTQAEVGPDIWKAVNRYRKDQGKPLLSEYSIEDIRGSMPGVNPKAEQGMVDSLIAARTGYQEDIRYTPEMLLQAAKTAGVDTTTKGFNDFLQRSTGTSELSELSQPQMHVVFKALTELEPSETNRVLPEGTNATHFSEKQYQNFLKVFGLEKPAKPLDEGMMLEAVKEATNLTSNQDAKLLLDEAVKRGDIDQQKRTVFRVVDPKTNQVFTTVSNEEGAKNIAAKRGYEVRAEDVNDYTLGAPKVARTGFGIEEGYAKTGEAPSGFAVTDGDKVLHIAKTEADAKARAAQIATQREGMAKATESAIAKLQSNLKNAENTLIKMEAQGLSGTPQYTAAKVKIDAFKRKTQEQIKELQQEAESKKRPLTIKPAAPKPTGKKVFKVTEKGLESEFETSKEAEDYILANASPERLADLAQNGYPLIAKRAKSELRRRSEAAEQKAAEEAKAAEAQKAQDAADEAQIKELETQLKPLLTKFGMGDVALNISKALRGGGVEAEYVNKVITLAIDVANPVRTMRHESLHALRDLGFFTEGQWKMLNNMADKVWIDKYLKQRAPDGTPLQPGQVSRFERYQQRYGADNIELLREEAIADAFGDFDANGAPKGVFATLLQKMRDFFESLKNVFTGAGYGTAEGVFRKVEAGELKPTKEGGGAPTQAKPSIANAFKATKAEEEQADKYEEANGILPYTSAGYLNVPVRYSIKGFNPKKDYGTHPLTGQPLNKDGTLTVYYHTTKAKALEIGNKKMIPAEGRNRIYLTNESSGAEVLRDKGNFDHELDGSAVLINIDPDMLQVDRTYDNGRMDFFVPTAQGSAFFKKMQMQSIQKSRQEAITDTFSYEDHEKRIKSAVDAFKKLTGKQRTAALQKARSVLKQNHNVTSLMTENGKLEKTRTGEYQSGLTVESNIASMGLGLASAQKITDKANTCPRSAICEGLCLGETSGGNFMFGGAASEDVGDISKSSFRAAARMMQYLKTEALIMHPEEFATVLQAEIDAHKAWCAKETMIQKNPETGKREKVAKEEYKPAFRLNVTSDFKPEMFSGIIKGNPDAMFYDYTKLGSEPIAKNHHLTYSSTGFGQIVDGEKVFFKNKAGQYDHNWATMRKRLDNGQNVAMAFSSKSAMPKFLIDEETGVKYAVLNGDDYDARFLDEKTKLKKQQKGRGVIVGLKNKAGNLSEKNSTKKTGGFFVNYDPKVDGDTVVVPDQAQFKQKTIPIAKASLRSTPTGEDIVKRIEKSGVGSDAVHGLYDADDPLDATATNLDLPSVKKADVEYARGVIQDRSQAMLRKRFGDKLVAYRGATGNEGGNTVSLTLDKAVAERHAKRNNRDVRQYDVNIDDVLSYGEAIGKGTFAEQEIIVPASVVRAKASLRTSQSAQRPQPFYSALLRSVEELSMKSSPAQGWKDAIKGLVNKGAVKADEVEWTGLNDWLDLQQGKVNKEQVQEFLKNNGVQVEEVTLGAGSPEIEELLSTEDMRVEPEGDWRWFIESPTGSVTVQKSSAPTEEDAKAFAVRYFNGHINERNRERRAKANDSKYSQYTLPGGENYREVLLTLPGGETKKQAIARRDAAWEKIQEQMPAGMHPLRQTAWAEENLPSMYAEWQDASRIANGKKTDSDTAYRSSHWDQPNVLAHIRLNDRTDADGKRVLFVEEIQSDWGQEGKKRGFKQSVDRDVIESRMQAITARLREIAKTVEPEKVPELADEWNRLSDEKSQLTEQLVRSNSGVPTAPFVTKTEGWLNLALKRIITMAAEGGYDRVAFVNGEQSADRYDLSKQVESIAATRTKDGTYTLLIERGDGGADMNRRGVTEDGLESLVGKELAQKIVADTSGEKKSTYLSGIDLKVGGEGMKTFYDSIVPKATNELLRKLKTGAKLGEVRMERGQPSRSPSEATPFLDWMAANHPEVKRVDAARAWSMGVENNSFVQEWYDTVRRLQQPGFDVTPEMRSVAGNGLPLFSLRSAPNTPEFKRWFGDSKVVDENGKPLVVYHGTGFDFDVFEGARKGTEKAYFFSQDPELASSFATTSAGAYDGSASVMPVYLSMKNPLVIDYKGGVKWGNDRLMKQMLDQVWSGKHDGVIAHNVIDGHGDPTTIFAVVEPTQIKSAIGNSGEYSRTNPDIRASLRDIPEGVNADDWARHQDNMAEWEKTGKKASVRNVKEEINQMPGGASIWNNIQQNTGKRVEKNFVERILESLAGDNLSRIRAAAIHRYNRLGEAEAIRAKMYGTDIRLADENAESAALMSDLGASVATASFGFGRNKGGIPVYRNGVTTIDNSKKGLLEVFKPLAAYGDPEIYRAWQHYMGIKRGNRLDAQGKPTQYSNVSPAEAQALEQKFPEFAQVRDDWLAYNNGVMQYLVDTGVLSQEKANIFMQHADYIPFYRELDGDTTGPQIFSGISGVKQLKKLKGGEEKLGDMLETVIRNSQAAITMGMKNVAGQRAVKLAEDIGTATRLQSAPANMDNVITVMENGEKAMYLCADPLFINAVKSLNMAELPFINILSAPANLLRSMVTKDPGFILANMLRDSVDAYIRTGVKMTPIVDTLANFSKNVVSLSPELQKLYNAGILGGYEASGAIPETAGNAAKELRKRTGTRTTGEKLAAPFTSLWGQLENLTEASDAATRIAVYNDTLRRTGNEAEALFQALEVMNFHRKGASPIVRIATAAIPFLNARLQGLDNLFRAGIKPLYDSNATTRQKQLQKTMLVRGLTILGLSTMYAMAVTGDPEYEKQEDETRDNNWIIPIGNTHIKIPVPFEIGTLFKTVPERAYRYALGIDTPQDSWDSANRAIRSTFAFNPMPQAFNPLYEVQTNYSQYTRRPIISAGMENIAPAFQYDGNTPAMFRVIGEATGLSPKKMEHLWQGYTGTMGTYAVQLMDSVFDGMGMPLQASKRFEQQPFIKRFVADPEARGQVTAFYDLKNRVDEVVRTVNLLQKEGSPELPAYLQENATLYAARGVVSSINQQLTTLNGYAKQIRASDMKPDEKRDLLLQITKAQNELTNNIRMVRKTLMSEE